MIIDFHTHVFPPRICENRSDYVNRDATFAALYSSKEAKLATAEELIAKMDETGVDVAVMLNLGWRTHELCVETNDYIMDSVARNPKRLVGFGMVQFQSPHAIKEIERCARGGLKGIGEWRPEVGGPGILQQELMPPVIEAIRRQNLILLVHASEPVGHVYPGKEKITPEALYPFIASYPGLTLVCAHWGGGLPFYALMPEVKQALQNVYFDTAASPFLYRPDVYRQVSQLAGPEKILFGSDYPLLSPARLMKQIEAAELPREAKDRILGENARRLLGV